jgi:FkbM family methyltransferase
MTIDRLGGFVQRLWRDLVVGARLAAHGFTLDSVVRYPLRRRGSPPCTRLDHRDGAVLVGGPDDDLCALVEEVWIDRCYEVPEWRFPQGATIVDVGANLGAFAVWVHRQRVPQRLLCVEPSPRSLAWLRANLAHNGVDAEVIDAACGTPGRAMLFAGERPSGDALHAPAGAAPVPLGEVEVLALDAVLARAAGADQVWLKLDCEGAECEVLASATPEALRRIAGLVVEHHPATASWSADELGAWLEVRGLTVVARRPGRGAGAGADLIYARRT